MTDSQTRSAARAAALIALPVAVAAGLIVFAVLGGYGARAPRPTASPATGPVTMPAPDLTTQTATVCRALVAALPSALRDRGQRPVTSGPEQNAAYGDPPITLACGAGTRPSIDPTGDVYVLGGVCWYETPGAGSATVWSAIDRTTPVTVTVPAGYDQPGQWVIEFSGPVGSSVPPRPDVPFGCHG